METLLKSKKFNRKEIRERVSLSFDKYGWYIISHIWQMKGNDLWTDMDKPVKSTVKYYAEKVYNKKIKQLENTTV